MRQKISSRLGAAAKLVRQREGFRCRCQVDAEEGEEDSGRKLEFRRGPHVDAEDF